MKQALIPALNTAFRDIDHQTIWKSIQNLEPAPGSNFRETIVRKFTAAYKTVMEAVIRNQEPDIKPTISGTILVHTKDDVTMACRHNAAVLLGLRFKPSRQNAKSAFQPLYRLNFDYAESDTEIPTVQIELFRGHVAQYQCPYGNINNRTRYTLQSFCAGLTSFLVRKTYRVNSEQSFNLQSMHEHLRVKVDEMFETKGTPIDYDLLEKYDLVESLMDFSHVGAKCDYPTYATIQEITITRQVIRDEIAAAASSLQFGHAGA